MMTVSSESDHKALNAAGLPSTNSPRAAWHFARAWSHDSRTALPSTRSVAGDTSGCPNVASCHDAEPARYNSRASVVSASVRNRSASSGFDRSPLSSILREPKSRKSNPAWTGPHRRAE
jgi:hypothetical protein